MMNKKDEIERYNRAKVSVGSGEIEEFDQVIFPNVIRRRQVDLITSRIIKIPAQKIILDFGCGGGWLSRVLALNGKNVVGIDVNRRLVRGAKEICLDSEFLVGDCMNLPFREKCFDAIIGIGILHHLNIFNGLNECRRVATEGSLLLFMEPNKLNPIASLGRKIFPMQTHTKGEKAPTLQELSLFFAKARLTIKESKHLFFYSFGLARLFRRQNLPKIIVPLISVSEKLFEEIPMIRSLSAAFFVVAMRN